MTIRTITLVSAFALLLAVTPKRATPQEITPRLLEYWRSQELLPPAEFDYPYPGEIIIKRLTQDELREKCADTPYRPLWGCTYSWGSLKPCEIYIARDEDLYTVPDYNFILRHEIGHCNGWRHKINRCPPWMNCYRQ